jgi:hypothetical protein
MTRALNIGQGSSRAALGAATALLFVLAACGEPAGGADAGANDDASTALDAAPPSDAGASDDASTALDAAPPSDAAAPTDATTADGGALTCGGVGAECNALEQHPDATEVSVVVGEIPHLAGGTDLPPDGVYTLEEMREAVSSPLSLTFRGTIEIRGGCAQFVVDEVSGTAPTETRVTQRLEVMSSMLTMTTVCPIEDDIDTSTNAFAVTSASDGVTLEISGGTWYQRFVRRAP